MRAASLIGARRAPAAARLLTGAAALKGLALLGVEDGADGIDPFQAFRAPILLIEGEAAAGPIAGLDLLEALFPEPTLFPNGNRGMPLALTSWAMEAARGPSQAAAALVARQLADGRAFLQGAEPGLADLQSDAALLATPQAETRAAVRSWRRRLADALAARREAGPRAAPASPLNEETGDGLVLMSRIEGPNGRALRLRTSAYEPGGA